MINLSKDIRSMSDFKRNTQELVDEMEASGRPMVLTVNGKAKVVVQDAAAYQKLLNTLDEADAIEGIKRGLDDVAHGRTQPLHQAMADIRRKYKIRARRKG
jgi:prevent-host-death family protein